MLDYLINYGVKRHVIEYEDIDITDKLNLQDQINKVRKEYFQLLSLLDDVQKRYLDVTNSLSKRSKELIQENTSSRNNAIFSSDDEYVSLEYEQLALKNGMNMINSQIEFCKSDLKILNSVFYNKF